MDFSFNAEETAFKKEIREFLKKELPSGWNRRIVSPMLDTHEHDDVWAVFKDLARKMGERGWLSLTWPKEYGGQEAPPMFDLILQEELFYHGAPGRDPFGVAIIAPTIIEFASETQREKYLGPIARGEQFWCQLWSEPEAGSDLAALKVSAVEKDDCYVINGQKVWTSGAHRVDMGFLLARTDPEAYKHKGISCLVLDMKTPGITINPLVNMTGAHGFNEVYFDDVRIPKENLLGEKNHGWPMVMRSAEYERGWIEPVILGQHILDEVIEYIKETDNGKLMQDTNVRHRLAEMEISIKVGRLLGYRAFWLNTMGVNAGYQAAESKVFGTEVLQAVAGTALQLLGLYGQLGTGSKWVPVLGNIHRLYLASIGFKHGGGTSEIQRNAIALVGMGLPR